MNAALRELDDADQVLWALALSAVGLGAAASVDPAKETPEIDKVVILQFLGDLLARCHHLVENGHIMIGRIQ